MPIMQIEKIRREELKIIHKVIESGTSRLENQTQLCSDPIKSAEKSIKCSTMRNTINVL